MPTYFYVTRISPFSTTNTPIPFDLAKVNIGNAMELASGKFRAPRPGIYFFSFTGHAFFYQSVSELELAISLYLNGNRIGWAEVEEANTSDGQFSPLTLQSTIKLKAGDQIWLQIVSVSEGVVLFDRRNPYTHFTGWMLEEDIVASLSTNVSPSDWIKSKKSETKNWQTNKLIKLQQAFTIVPSLLFFLVGISFSDQIYMRFPQNVYILLDITISLSNCVLKIQVLY